MAWEMQSHMVEYIAPSLKKVLSLQDNDLGFLLADKFLWDSTLSVQIATLSDMVREYRTTTNGAHEFYISEDYPVTVPWCSEEEKSEYWNEQT